MKNIEADILDLAAPINQWAMRRINWQVVKAAWAEHYHGRHGDCWGIFLAAVCKPHLCPLQPYWRECRGKDKSMCHYYDILKTLELGRKRKVERNENTTAGP